MGNFMLEIRYKELQYWKEEVGLKKKRGDMKQDSRHLIWLMANKELKTNSQELIMTKNHC